MNTRHAYPFEKLRVWQDARQLVVDLDFLSQSEESQLRDEVETISRQLNALRKAQLSS